MSFERKNPIPPGRYWLDIPASREASYNSWAEKNLNIQTVSDRRNGTMTFIVFEVGPTAAERWPVEAGLGFPTIDPTGKVQAPEDVVQRPSPEKPFDFGSMFEGTGKSILIFGLLYVICNKGK